MLREWRNYLWILLASVAASLVIFEAYARLTKLPAPAWNNAAQFLWYDAQKSTALDYHPYIGLYEEPFSGTYPFGKSGEAGDPWYPKEKPPGVYRVIILGGSVVQSPAFEVENGKFTPSTAFSPPAAWWRGCAQELTNAAGRRVEVLAAGLQAAVTTNEVIKLLTADLLDWQPDMVLMLDGYNDVDAAARYGRRPGLDYFVPFQRFFRDHPLAFGTYGLLSWSEGARRIFESYAHHTIARELVDLDSDALAARMAKNYSFAAALARGVGADFAVVLQPTLYMHRRVIDAEPGHPMPKALAAVAERLMEWATPQGIPLHVYHALLESLPDETFYDHVPFTGAGYRRLCEQLALDLGARIR